MGQDIDLKKAALALAVSSWRRDYEQSLELKEEAFKREAVRLLEALKVEVGQLGSLLYAEHEVEWTGDNSLRLTEGERKEKVVDCYLNLANPGRLVIQLAPRFGNQTSEEFVMIRNSREEYGWICRGDNITTEDLATLIIQQILEAANRVVSHGVKNNPRL